MSVFWIIPARLLMPPITEPWNSLGAITCPARENGGEWDNTCWTPCDVASRIGCREDNRTLDGPIRWLPKTPLQIQPDGLFQA